MMIQEDVKKLLAPALRQYKHNDGGNEFVGAFDYNETMKIFFDLLKNLQNGQIGELYGVDFETNTWTFKMPDGFHGGSGSYYIARLSRD